MTKHTVDIILPAYHEQGNIEKVIQGIKKNVKTPHLITIVLQDRKDPTFAVIKKIQKKTKGVDVIFTKNGKGVLKALKEGFKHTHAPLITVMMSDLSDNPKDIDKMIKKINAGCYLVCGSRYSKRGKRVGGPIFKGFLSYLACVTLRTFTKIPTNDATNAFKTYRREIFNHIKIESREGFELPLEITVKTQNLGLKIGEVPTVWLDREAGVSKFHLFKNIPYYLRWYRLGIKSAILRSWKIWAQKINKKFSPLDHLFILTASLFISVFLYVITINFIPINFQVPETTAINWLTFNNYPKQQDYYLFFSFFSFTFLGTFIMWFLWVSSKTKN